MTSSSDTTTTVTATSTTILKQLCSNDVPGRRVFLFVKTWLVFLIDTIASLWQQQQINSPREKISKNQLQSQDETLIKTQDEVMQKTIRDVPGPFAFPYFGSSRPKLKAIQTVDYCRELFQKYGPIVKFEFFNNIPILFLLDGEDIKRVMYECTGEIRPPMQHMIDYRKSRPDLFDSVGLVNSNGQEWENLHKGLAKITLNHSNISTLNEGYNEILSDSINFIESEAGIIDFQHYFSRISVECSFHTFFGLRMGIFETKTDSCSVGTENLFELMQNYFDSFHTYVSEFRLLKYYQTWQHGKLEKRILDLIDELTQHCLKTEEGSVIFKKFLKSNLSYKDKRMALLEFFSGATDPVQNQLIFILYEICRNEDVERKVFEELKAALITPDTFIYDADVTKLPYLKACITEAMRLSPVAPNLARVTNASTEIQGYKIPPYTVVIGQALFAGALSPDMFYKPKEFLPERWLGEGNITPFKPHRPDVICPFGMNRRACPGRRLAISMSIIIIGRLLRKYKITFQDELRSHFDFINVVIGPAFAKLEERPE